MANVVIVMAVISLLAVPYFALGVIVRLFKKSPAWKAWATWCLASIAAFMLSIAIATPLEAKKKADEAARVRGASIVPEGFQGAWASDLDSCNDYNSRAKITGDEVSFPAMGFMVKSLVSQSPSEVVLAGFGTLQGTTESDTVTLRLSADQQKIMIIVGTPSNDDSYWAKCPS